MKPKYCSCGKKGLHPDIDENKHCVRCGKKVYGFLEAYKKVRKTTLIDSRTRVKQNDKLYNRKKAKKTTRKRIAEEL